MEIKPPYQQEMLRLMAKRLTVLQWRSLSDEYGQSDTETIFLELSNGIYDVIMQR